LQIEFLVCDVAPAFESHRNHNSSTAHLCASAFQTAL
jgi:hypothetical protein